MSSRFDVNFADALRGDSHRLVWNHGANGNGHPVAAAGPSNAWHWPWERPSSAPLRVVHRLAEDCAESPGR